MTSNYGWYMFLCGVYTSMAVNCLQPFRPIGFVAWTVYAGICGYFAYGSCRPTTPPPTV